MRSPWAFRRVRFARNNEERNCGTWSHANVDVCRKRSGWADGVVSALSSWPRIVCEPHPLSRSENFIFSISNLYQKKLLRKQSTNWIRLNRPNWFLSLARKRFKSSKRVRGVKSFPGSFVFTNYSSPQKFFESIIEMYSRKELNKTPRGWPLLLGWFGFWLMSFEVLRNFGWSQWIFSWKC